MRVHSVEQQEKPHRRPNTAMHRLRLVLTAALSVLGGGFHFGFQVSIINPLAEVLQTFLMHNMHSAGPSSLSVPQQALVWSVVAGSLFVGAAMGAAIMAWLIDRHGPRRGILLAAVVLFVSVPLCGLSHLLQSSELFVIGRFVSGVGVGMGTTAHGVFLADISPVRLRGVIGSFGGFSTNIGFISAGALGLPLLFGNSRLWPVVYYIEAAPCLLLMFAAMFWFHDSPLYLLRVGLPSEAEAARKAYSGEEDDVIEETRTTKNHPADGMGLWQILSTRSTRRALSLSVTLNVAVSFSGILAVSFFGTFLLSSMGFSPLAASLANCLSGLAGTAGAVVATVAVDRIGRRFLVLGGLLLLAAVNTSMMLLVYLFNSTANIYLGWAFLALFILFLFVFSSGIGPTAWFLGAELAPPEARAKIQSISIASQYISCFVSPIVYYPLHGLIGPLSFLVFVIPLLAAAIYFYTSLPETKGRTSEQISAMLE